MASREQGVGQLPPGDSTAFWRNFVDLAPDQQWPAFLLLAASVLNAVNTGQLTIVDAGKALAPARYHESLMHDGNTTIAAYLASDLASNTLDDDQEREATWQQLRCLLTLYL